MSAYIIRNLADGWASYESEVVPADAGDIQRTETRLAFYGGANVALNLVMALAENGDVEASARVLQSLHEELESFGAGIKAIAVITKAGGAIQ